MYSGHHTSTQSSTKTTGMSGSTSTAGSASAAPTSATSTTTTVPVQQQQQQHQHEHSSQFSAPRAEATTQAHRAPESSLQQSSSTSEQWSQSQPQTTSRTDVARAYVVQERVAVPVVLTTTTTEEEASQQQQETETVEVEKKILKGKVALVTGATSGIGLATARTFRDQGATVVITAKCEESCNKEQCEHVEGFDVVVTDVSNMNDLNRLMEHIQQKYGGLDILFSNAGLGLFRATPEVDEQFYDTIMNTNVKGTYFTVSKALPIMRTGSTVILNASNVSEMGWPGGSVYAASKAAVRSLARTWTLEVPPSKVRFNVLSPGAVETRLLDRLGKTREEAQKVKEAMLNKIPAGRFASPEEIARVALFLSGPDSVYICGEEIRPDGGWAAC